ERAVQEDEEESEDDPADDAEGDANGAGAAFAAVDIDDQSQGEGGEKNVPGDGADVILSGPMGSELERELAFAGKEAFFEAEEDFEESVKHQITYSGMGVSPMHSNARAR